MLSSRPFFKKVALSFGLLLGLVFVLATSSFASPIILGTQTSTPEFFFTGTGGGTINVTMLNCSGSPLLCIIASGSAATIDGSAGTYTLTTGDAHPFALVSNGDGTFTVNQTAEIDFVYNATSGSGTGTVLGTVQCTSAVNDPMNPDSNHLLCTLTITGGTFATEIAEFECPNGITTGAMTLSLGNAFNLNLLIGTTLQDNSEIDFGEIVPSCPPPVTSTCPLTQGFWKNHPNAWPVSSLVIGGVSLTEAQLIAILKTPPKGGNAVLILEHQLIAALLNIDNGTVASPLVLDTIADAEALLTGAPAFVAASSTLGQQMVADANILDSFNNGVFSRGCTNDTSLTVRRR